MNKKPAFHGSDLELIEKHYHIPREEIISFSSNVNPLGMSPLFKKSVMEHIDAITSYPDRDYSNLRTALSAYCETSVEHILVGSGATDLISRFIRETNPKKALLIDPTYSEYSRELALGGSEMTSFQLKPTEEFQLNCNRLFQVLDDSLDLLILCNPNNPTGTLLLQPMLRRILDKCRSHDICVLIDETYMEFSSDLKQATAIPLAEEFDNLFIIRGVSKFFAAPGLRLGYGICSNPSLIESINSKKNPWGINTYAAVCGAEMFRDIDYIHKTQDFVRHETARVLEYLKALKNAHCYTPNANFILIKILNNKTSSFEVFEAAIKKGMMIRDCSSFPGFDDHYIRFCLCRPDENDRLLRLLTQMLA